VTGRGAIEGGGGFPGGRGALAKKGPRLSAWTRQHRSLSSEAQGKRNKVHQEEGN